MGDRAVFSCQAALERLVARNPRLKDNPSILQLLAKGFYLKDEDVVDVLSELLLEPSLTVAVIGCFRPFLVRIVNNLMELLHKIQSSGTCADKVQESLDAHELLLNKSWSLKLHDYVVIAFSRSLELVPFLLRSMLHYFSFAPPPFERLLRIDLSILTTENEIFHLLDIIRASYRFLYLEPKIFCGLWDWSPFLELLQWSCNTDKVTVSSETVSDVRWCAVQVLSTVLRMSDKATRDLSYKLSDLTEEMAFACLLRWEEFCQDVALEKAGWFLESKELGNKDFIDGNMNLLQQSGKHVVFQSTARFRSSGSGTISHLEICGIDLPVRKGLQNEWAKSIQSSFVITSNMKKSLEAIVLAVSEGQPILLEGPSGVGKTTLINELAQITGNSDVLFIHLDDQTDNKTLIGSYVCTEIPGEFKWQAGSLTQAVVNGFWVVFEDADKAPSDILSVLVSLLEDRKLYIPGRGEAIPAAEGFQLFATITKFNSGFQHGISGRETFNNLWRKIVVDAPSDEELIEIVKVRFPDLQHLAPKLIDTLNMVNCIALQKTGFAFGGCASVYAGRQFSIRDLLKWCIRIMDSNLSFDWNMLSSCIRERIYNEAIDIFAACIPCKESRQFVMRKIAELWNVSDSQAEYLDQLNKPQIQSSKSMLQVGRVSLLVHQRKNKLTSARAFANTGNALRVLERIACSVKHNEPVLLVGETGTGKTTLVQYLAVRIGMPLTVVNLSQQSDSTDFLGGFKPIEARLVCIPLLEVFSHLFCSTFPSEKNAEFLARIRQFAEKKKWDQLLKAFQIAVDKVAELVGSEFSRFIGLEHLTSDKTNNTNETKPAQKRKKFLNREVIEQWQVFSVNLHRAQRQIEASKTSFAFSFVEGALVKAMRDGHWILLDEVNLAPIETLQRLSGVLEGEKGSLCLTEKGDVECVTRHPDFRIFACMNPATDIGKRDLPISIKSRFTEFFVDDLSNVEDLGLLVYQYLEGMLPSLPVDDIVRFYKEARKESEARLFDGANQKPQYSLRSLARALEYTRAATPTYGFQRALYDGICMLFVTLLDRSSSALMEQIIASVFFKESGPMAAKALNALLKPPPRPSPDHVQFEQYWIERGTSQVSKASVDFCKHYVLTKSIREHLKNLARAVFIHQYPVLLQGPTSSGKTSLIEYLATITGHRFVRINNHEHTDLQEYLGTYITNSSGKLVFQEGILVEAVRKGYWIVLDELNLAPSDVLEALNRLLDDNRELFVPELQLTVKPHPHFMLFATQNPPGIYGGRKVLSRAFRNRFLELHVDDIPEDELCMILERRCEVPPSYATKMVEVMKDLQRHRQSSKVFAGKHGFITPRDLFRWADRFRNFGKSYEDLAMDGYFLLAERLRDENEKAVVQGVLERHLRVKIDIEKLYQEDSTRWRNIMNLSMTPETLVALGKVVWTKSMRRLFYLVERCYEQREPVLLVGETGSGKTTVCQLLSHVLKLHLHILNCHQHTETSDFLGGFRPVRERNSIGVMFQDMVKRIMSSNFFSQFHKGKDISFRIEDATTTLATISQVLHEVRANCLSKDTHSELYNKAKEEIDALEFDEQELIRLHKDWQSLFVWHDGPLVQAMRNGDFFLVDEISLADDSVLERLNSVLEPSRVLVLAEKGGPVLEELTGHPQFFLLATMNPGGDFGKKELSPALRNRFTEIWVPPVTELDDLRNIALERFSKPELMYLAEPLLKFWEWFQHKACGRVLTVRDLLSWITFINVIEKEIGADAAFIHGAFLVLLDGISLGTGMSNVAAERLRNSCLNFLLQQLQADESSGSDPHIREKSGYGWGNLQEDSSKLTLEKDQLNGMFGIDPFYILKGFHGHEISSFELAAPTTSRNAFRILRAMQLHKPVLLEGSPGVGKTSLVAALANCSNHKFVRINLSEQTDIMDLLGSDLPVEGSKGIEFQWSDGILLQALKSGSWVLLDELNLAPQSVLEGLNAILDHRGEVFVPELGCTFKCPPTFRAFACQNPSSQGGGRKGLPKSFLNRFTKVYVDSLHEDDFLFISSALHPSISRTFLSKLIYFNSRLHEDTMIKCKYGQIGSPWEFNLRDILRSCYLIEGSLGNSKDDCFLNVVYLQRMRTVMDRQEVLKLYEEVFGVSASINVFPKVKISPQNLFVGNAVLPRHTNGHGKPVESQLHFLPGLGNCLEAVMHCVKQGWMSILIGPSASGKTSMVRLLAELTGNSLHEYNLSSGTDISELLGCFEQYDAFYHWHDTIIQVRSYVEELCGIYLCATVKELSAEHRKSVVKDLLGSWAAFENCINSRCTVPVRSSRIFDKSLQSGSIDCLSIGLLMKIVEKLRHFASALEISVSWSGADIDNITKVLLDLEKTLDLKGVAGHFEWTSGVLIKALQHGEWVVLENANLCNPTVLDRLNSLLEGSGLITVNERGLVNGEPMVVHAHSKFRVFLTVNPNHGELSRAMRNRGIELYIMQPYWMMTGKDSEYEINKSGMQDVKRFLTLSGFPVSNLIDAMAKAHDFVKNEVSRFGIFVSLRELSQWVQLLWRLLMRGRSLSWSLYCSWEQVYVYSLDNIEARNAAFRAQELYLSKFGIIESEGWFGQALSLPGGWPVPLELRKYVQHSKEAIVKRDCMYLEFLGAQYASFKISIEGIFRIKMCANEGEDGILLWLKSKQLSPSLFPCYFLRYFLFPSLVSLPDGKNEMVRDCDLTIVDCMLFHAATWMIEQASFSDLGLRLHWLHWYASKVAPYCQFFKSFASTVEKEMDHPITKCLLSVWSGIRSSFPENLDLQLLSCFSIQSLNSVPPGVLNAVVKRLRQLIKGASMLRYTMWQWKTEDEGDASDVVHKYGPLAVDGNHSSLPGNLYAWLHPVLSSLRQLENEVLIMTTEMDWDEQMDLLFTRMQESHAAFWKSISRPLFEVDILLICWGRLKKFVARMLDYVANKKDIFQASESFFQASKNLDAVLCLNCTSSKSLLWKYGGHPLLPVSTEIYNQQQRLLDFCHVIWSADSWQMPSFDSGKMCFVVSAEPDFRHLAMQGVSMALCIHGKVTDVDSHKADNECEEIYQMLLERFEAEKASLRNKLTSELTLYPSETVYGTMPANCKCSSNHVDNFLPSEVLCLASAYELWVRLLPLADCKSLCLDVSLLEVLSERLLPYTRDCHQATLNIAEALRKAITFALQSSSRSPLDFVPHQKMLWILDAHCSADVDSTELSSAIHDMWFRWHSALWMLPRKPDTGDLECEWKQIQGPPFIIQAAKTMFLTGILKPVSAAKNYSIKLMQLRVASTFLWRYSERRTDICKSIFNAASILFQQIVNAHHKSFNKDDMQEIQSILSYLHQSITEVKDGIDPQMLDRLKLLLESSKHEGLVSLIDSFIQPLMNDLYSNCSIPCFLSDSLYKLGRVWYFIGGLRFRLLVNFSAIDPVTKAMHKYCQLLEKISQLELEIKVRQECETLTGQSLVQSEVQEKISALKELKIELHKLRSKVVYRPDPSQYKALNTDCVRFLESTTASLRLDSVTSQFQEGVLDLQLATAEIQNWQANSMFFIDRLSKEYAPYKDIIQPIQLAIYELKFGLSLVEAASFQRKIYSKVGVGNIDNILEILCLLMDFPSGHLGLSSCIRIDNQSPEIECTSLHGLARLLDKDVLKCISEIISLSGGDKEVIALQSKVTILHICLMYVGNNILQSLVMNKPAMQLLNTIFDSLTSLWVEMKDQVKAKADHEAEVYRFKPRSCQIGNDLEIDEHSFRKFFPKDIWVSEWQDNFLEPVAEKEHNGFPGEHHEMLEEGWNSIEESVLHDVVRVHSRLFGSTNLVQYFGKVHVSDEERLHAFTLSYEVGKRLIEGTGYALPAGLDEKISSGHLLRLCLEYQNLSQSLPGRTCGYNIYKDSNTSEVVLMVKPLLSLQERVNVLLKEWPEHPGLQQILQIITKLLGIPLDAPLMKALTGVQYLLDRSQLWEENAPRMHSFADELRPFSSLVTRWRKIEFECWPALLDEIQLQHEVKAEELWFPLRSILYRKMPGDPDVETESTISSLEEFMQTATIGEFRKRLELVLTFHGQFSSQICLEVYPANLPSSVVIKHSKIMYNIFGYYVQFLPMISQSIKAGRQLIEKELKEFSQLCKWEDRGYYSLTESSRRTHQKLHKLIQKFNDVLQRPVMALLSEETMKMGAGNLGSPEFKPSGIKGETCIENTLSQNYHVETTGAKRSFHSGHWSRYNETELQSMSCMALQTSPENVGSRGVYGQRIPLHMNKVICYLSESIFSEAACNMRMKGQNSLEKLCSSIAYWSYDLCKNESKRAVKKKALTDLLKVLKSVGLSHHKSAVPKEERDVSSWFLQPYFNVSHLFKVETHATPAKMESNRDSRQFEALQLEESNSNWKLANEYYFKNMALMQRLRQSRLNFHKDLSLREVEISSSFLEHLLYLQRRQRRVAYEFSSKLQKLHGLAVSLKDFVHGDATDSSVLPHQQHAIYGWMWRQKHLFDCLCTVIMEMSLLLKTVKVVHNCPFSSVGSEVNKLQIFIDTFVPTLNHSKATLDKYLLGSDLINVNSHKQSCTFVCSKPMEEAVFQNFLVMKDMHAALSGLLGEDCTGESSTIPALNRVSEFLFKGIQMFDEFNSDVDLQRLVCNVEEPDAIFVESHDRAISEILIAVQNVKGFTDGEGLQDNSDEHSSAEETLNLCGTIQTWESIFDRYMSSIRLDKIHDALAKTMTAAVKLVNYGGQKRSEVCLSTGNLLGCLYLFVDLILNAGNAVLFDFVNLHKTVATMAFVLSNIFASLYSDGFRTTKQEPEKEGDAHKFEDASGTGMGQGEGMKDVSDQIEDEDQLLGSSDKQSEEPAASDKAVGETDKGIEMEQDFSTSDMFSVSEDSGNEDSEDDENENLESTMGDAGNNNEVIDEKLWNKEEDHPQENSKEKYEMGASVQDMRSDDMELRAKQDFSNNETGTQDRGDEKVSKNDDVASPVDSGAGNDDNESPEELTMNKDDAYEDPTGMQLHAEEEFKLTEDMEIEEPAVSEIAEEEQSGSDLNEQTTENTIKEDNGLSNFENVDMNVDEQGGGGSSGEEQLNEQAENNNQDNKENPSGEAERSAETCEGFVQVGDEHTQPAFQPTSDSLESNSNLKAHPVSQDVGVISEAQQDVALGDNHSEGDDPMRGAFSHSACEMASSVPDDGRGGNPVIEPKLSSSSANESQSLERMNANPYRSIGDALKDWKERVKVSDITSQHSNKTETADRMEELEMDGGEEYWFVSDGEKSNAQALGAATADQLDQNLDKNNSIGMEDDFTETENMPSAIETEDNTVEKNPTLQQTVATVSTNKMEIKKQFQGTINNNVPFSSEILENEINSLCEIQKRCQSESFVSIERQQVTSLQSSWQLATNDHTWTEEDARNIRRDIEMMFREDDGNYENAALVWTKYEQLTTRLSHELAEQLRLIMEPTLASRLEGDYRTGKRINMKKVIPYIASQFRKDKIWLRRTKPSKRQYQVVIAIDDSRSMSESHCGHMALEALVTICRAMSQLEVGQFAVTSFGEKGNVRLLHDFDQQFSSEAGLKMISMFSFKQDNTIADEPVVDLLKYLAQMLEIVAMNTRAPSGRADVQQLVLIIADGRFHEKESLKCRVRDALSRKQLLAFIVLDNPEESIMDVQSVSFTSGVPAFSKYLDSFPFPYYIILKDIEALPRTLADLLKQWFELMQLTNI